MPLSVDDMNGYACQLSIPFVDSLPIDYTRMTQDQLKKFIAFVYKSQYSRDLPPFAPKTKPEWWPESITFDKNLNWKSTKKNYRHNLSSLLESMYRFHGASSLLMLGAELSNVHNSDKFRLQKGHSCWRVLDTRGRTVVLIDDLSVNYDQKPIQAHVAKKRTNPLPATKKTISTKRKLFDDESESPDSPVSCKHCQKQFAIPSFCEEHEQSCTRNLATKEMSLPEFMSILGMVAGDGNPAPASSTKEEKGGFVKRPLRRLPKRSQFAVPITSERGKRLLKEVQEKAEYKHPAAYEAHCETRPGYRQKIKSRGEGKYPNVMKKFIAKHAENGHKYSYGRRQRMERNEEIVLGLSIESARLLNKMKDGVVKLRRLKPIWNTLTLAKKGKNAKDNSLMEKRFIGARLSRVLLDDCMKTRDPQVLKYVSSLKTKKSDACGPHGRKVSSSSSSSSVSLFEPVARSTVTLQNLKKHNQK